MQNVRSIQIFGALFSLGFVVQNMLGADLSREVEGFSSITMLVGGEVTLVRSDESRVELSVVKGDPAEFRVEVSEGSLRLYRKLPDGTDGTNTNPFSRWFSKMRRGIGSSNELQVRGTVFYTKLNGITSRGSGRILASGLSEGELNVAVLGAGSVDLERVESQQLTVAVKGSGDVNVREGAHEIVSVDIRGSGDVQIAESTAQTVSVEIKGSGDYTGSTLRSKYTSVSVVGSGDADVYATDELNVSIRGSGDVRYAGNPKINQRVIGSGDLLKL